MTIDEALHKVCGEYGIELNYFVAKDKRCTPYDTKIIAKGKLAHQISIERDQETIYSDLKGYEIVIYYDRSKFDCIYLTLQEYDNFYEKILRFFKDNDVLTKDEMIIKDIIE